MLEMESRSILIFVLILAVATVMAFILYRRTSPTLPRRTRIMLGVLRWIAAFLFLAIVLAPTLRIVRTSTAAPSVAVLVNVSKSMTYPAPDEKIGAAKAILSEGFLQALEKKARVRLFEFSDTAGPANPGNLAGLAPAGRRTDLAAGVASALDAFEAKPSAVVLVTDGASNFGEDPLHFCSTLRIPVYTISLASSRPTPDISVDRIETNETAYAGSKVPVSVYVSGRSRTGSSTLAIRDSVAEVFRQEVTLSETGAMQRVAAQIDAGEVGVHSLRADLSPFDGEQVVANNSVPFSIKVIKGKIRVTLVAPRPSWDFAFARRSLEADPNVDVAIVFSPGGPVAVRTERAAGDFARAISESDVVVVLSGAALGPAAARLDSFVRDGGGVLLVSPDASVDIDEGINPFVVSGEAAGTSPSTSAARNGTPQSRGGTPLPQVRPLLYAPVPVEGGSEHQIMDVEALRGGSLWSSLPPIPVDASIAGAKPPATVLLSGAISNAPQEAEGGGQPQRNAPTTAQPASLPLVAVMKYGMGRTVAFAGHDLWRWDLVPKGFGVEVSAFSELLRSSVRWLAEAEQTKRLALSTGKADYLLGEPIAVLGRLSDENLKPVQDATVVAQIHEQASGTLALTSTMVERTPG
ncbi:MAG: hypothetical protein LUO79_02905, partial [Methanomassiliicoccales archaeon]|nr:hypothetical protein [Methanomassiliicoccales archaeon]